MLRTHTCGELRKNNVGEVVTLAGWVRRVRDLGGLIFIDLRDRYGVIQVVVEPQNEDAFSVAKKLNSQDVVQVTGVVRARPDEMVNPELETGEIEVLVDRITVLNESKTPPFPVEDDIKASEETRLRWRFLDLRRPVMQKNIILKHRFMQSVRNFLTSEGFIEIETPFLTKSTPEGARDFIVPSRIYPGKFYALPQSPQLYKQILMVSGFDRYFQIVRCFRDEDLRADRQPEFTQIDLEMSFVDVDDVLSLVERMMHHVLYEVMGIEIDIPFPRLSYQEAMKKYGIDKPDLRFGMELEDLTEKFSDTDFRVLRNVIDDGGKVVGIRVPVSISRKQIEELTEFVRELGAGGLLWFKFENGKVSGQLSKYVSFSPEGKGTYLIVASKEPDVYKIAGQLRLEVARKFELIDRSLLKFLWIVDFPLYEVNEETGELEPAHHMFTHPTEDTIHYLDTDPLKVIAKQYDLVLNGVELASGSIRVHNRMLQEKIMEKIGFTKERMESRFGFLLEALEYGAPPHGGIAVGFDRFVAIFAGRESIRDVIPFPKTTKAQALFEGAPSSVDEEQLKELHIMIIEEENKDGKEDEEKEKVS